MNCLADELSSMVYKLPGCAIHSRKITTFSLLRGTNRISIFFFLSFQVRNAQVSEDIPTDKNKPIKDANFLINRKSLEKKQKTNEMGRPERTQGHNKIAQAESTYANLLLINVDEVLGHRTRGANDDDEVTFLRLF